MLHVREAMRFLHALSAGCTPVVVLATVPGLSSQVHQRPTFPAKILHAGFCAKSSPDVSLWSPNCFKPLDRVFLLS